MDLILLWILAVLMTFSSTGSVETTESSEPAEPPSPAVAPSVVEQQFVERAPLPSCGTYRVAVGSIADAETAPGWDCLHANVEGSGGELKIVTSTTEGDPIRTYVRVTTEGQMEIYVDTTADAFGPQEWTFESCAVEQASFRQGCP